MTAAPRTPSETDIPENVAAGGSSAQGPRTASERLAVSRERLRQVMRNAPAPLRNARRGPASAWLNSLDSIPGASVLIDALGAWWAQHPLRSVSLVITASAKAALQPMAARSPFSLVLGAALLGGLLALTIPWRWILRPAVFAGLLPQLGHRAMAARAPIQSWMVALSSLAHAWREPVQSATP
jgi:hypothetical protein